MNDKKRKAMFAKYSKPHHLMNTPTREEVQMIKAIHGAKGVGKHTGAYTCHNCKGNDAVFRKVITRGGGKIITNHCVRCNTRV